MRRALELSKGVKKMKKKIIGILVFMLLITTAVLPVTSITISESENIESSVRMFYFLKIDFSGKGEAVRAGTAVNFNLTEGEGTIFALYSSEFDNGDIARRYFFESYNITSPARGFFGPFKGTVEYDPETEIVEIHGTAIFGVSGP
jgi:hypothetical protein